MSKLNECLDFLAEMAFRLSIQPTPDVRRLRSYENARESLKNAASLDGYQKLPFIGPSIAASLAEVIKTGRSSKLAEMRKLKGAPPSSLLELLRLRGIGPKTAIKLWKEADIKSMADFEKAVIEHRVNDPKLVDAFLKASNAVDRVSRLAVTHVMDPIIEHVKTLSKLGVIDVGLMGSFRRLRPDVRDIDVLVTLADLNASASVVKSVEKTFKLKLAIDGEGRKAVMEILVEGQPRNLEFTFCTEQEHGCAVIHFTGSKDFNVALRSIAGKRNMSLNEKCIQDLLTGKTKFFSSEAAVFKFFGLPYVPPECRDSYLFAEPTLPPILEMSELIADLHVHTKASDGQMTVADAWTSAKLRRYRAVGISDHSNGSGNGLKQEAAVTRALRIRQKKTGEVRLLAGVELDVKVNGQLDYDVQCLSNFNYVILALHNQSDVNVETRLGTAIAEIRKAHLKLPLIWAHPTGRLIGSRPEADIDWGPIFKLCAANRVALEINNQPTRLDLSDSKCRVAKRLGCKFVINSDSHGKELSKMDGAVSVARRALLTREDVINARGDSLVAWLRGGY